MTKENLTQRSLKTGRQDQANIDGRATDKSLPAFLSNSMKVWNGTG